MHVLVPQRDKLNYVSLRLITSYLTHTISFLAALLILDALLTFYSDKNMTGHLKKTVQLRLHYTDITQLSFTNAWSKNTFLVTMSFAEN